MCSTGGYLDLYRELQNRAEVVSEFKMFAEERLFRVFLFYNFPVLWLFWLVVDVTLKPFRMDGNGHVWNSIIVQSGWSFRAP